MTWYALPNNIVNPFPTAYGLVGGRQLETLPLATNGLTVRKKMKKMEPMNPPRIVVLLSAARGSRKTCIAANVSRDSAAAHTHE